MAEGLVAIRELAQLFVEGRFWSGDLSDQADGCRRRNTKVFGVSAARGRRRSGERGEAEKLDADGIGLRIKFLTYLRLSAWS